MVSGCVKPLQKPLAAGPLSVASPGLTHVLHQMVAVLVRKSLPARVDYHHRSLVAEMVQWAGSDGGEELRVGNASTGDPVGVRLLQHSLQINGVDVGLYRCLGRG